MEQYTGNVGLKGKWIIVCTTEDGTVIAINEDSHEHTLRGYEFIKVVAFEKCPEEIIENIMKYLMDDEYIPHPSNN